MATDREDARQRVLKCAAQLFAENGVHATSLADISQAAEVSKGTLYYHYTTKEMLVFDVCDIHLTHMMNKMYAWLKTVRDGADPKDVFSELIDIITDDIFDVKLHIALLSEAALGNFELQQLIRKRYSDMGLVIDLASLRIDISMHESTQQKQMFFMALDGLMLHSLNGLSAIDSRTLLERIYLD